MRRLIKILKIPGIWIIALFVVLSIFFYQPILNSNCSILGSGGGDDFGAISIIWQTKKDSAFNKQIDTTTNNLISYQHQKSDNLSINPLWKGIFSVLRTNLSEITVYNLINWISLPLSAIGMYFLVYYVTKSKSASIVAGIIYAFSPYHFIRMSGHIFLAHIEWFPFLILFLLKLVETKKYRYSIFAGVFFALNFFTDYYYGLFSCIFLIIFLSVRLFVTKSHITKQKLKLLAVFGLTVAILIGSYLIPIFLSQKNQKNNGMLNFSRPVKDLYQWGQQSVKYFLIPWHENYLFGDYYNKIFYKSKGIPEGESLAYLGIPGLLLAVYGIYKWQKEKPKNSEFNFIMILFIVTAITAAIFSFSPPISPSSWIYKILPQFRVYSRLCILVSLSITVLAGVGLKYLFESLKTSKLTKYIPAKHLTVYAFTLILIIVLLDFLPSFKTTDVSQVPAEYVWLKNQPKDTVIVEYPYVSSNYAPTPTYIFWQRIHQKPMINGQPETDPTGKEQIRQQITDVTNPKTAIILNKLGARYLFLHKDQFNKLNRDKYISPDIKLNKNINPKNINPNLEFIERFGQTYIYEIK